MKICVKNTSKFQIWAFLLKFLLGSGPFKTFEFEELLPKQPLPSLDETLDR